LTVFLRSLLIKAVRKMLVKLSPGGGTPPPVSADFNTSSIFLEKYMELDEQDRFAIGHRLFGFFQLVFNML